MTIIFAAREMHRGIFISKIILFIVFGFILSLHCQDIDVVVAEDLLVLGKDSCGGDYNDLIEKMTILEDRNSSLTKELDMARQIIGELNIKLANKENDLVSLNKAQSLSNNTMANMNIEEILLVSIEECSTQVKTLKSSLEECKQANEDCEAEKSTMKIDTDLLSVNTELLVNEKEHCLIELKRVHIEMAKLQNNFKFSSKLYDASQVRYTVDLLKMKYHNLILYTQSCEISECLKSVSTYDILNVLVGKYQNFLLDDLVPFIIRKFTYAKETMTSYASYFAEFIYPEITIIFKSTVSKAYYISKEAVAVWSSFWSTEVVPLYSFTLRPNTVRLYTVYLEPFITQQLVPLYKENLESAVDQLVSYTTAFYNTHLSFLVDDYLYPSYKWTSNIVNYVIYFAVKYLEQDDLFEVTLYNIINIWELCAQYISSFPLVDQIVGPSNSILFGRIVLTAFFTLVVIFLRNLFLALAAGLVMVVLSPLLAVIYVSAKVVGFLFPAGTAISTGKAPATPPSSQSRGNPDKSIVQKDTKVVARRSSSKTAVSRSFSNDSTSAYVKQSPGASQLPPRRPTVTKAISVNSTNLPSTRVGTSSPTTRSRTTSTGESIGPFSPSPWASPPSSVGNTYNRNRNLEHSPSAVEQLRNRKFPGIVTRGITPAAALGLVPTTRERSPFDNPMFRDDDDEDNEKMNESVAVSSQEKDFSFADL